MFGLALGAGMGALFGHFGEKGIDKAFQQQVRDYLKPGTSALFMVIEQATPDKAIAALEQYGGTVIRTSLSDEDTKRLQEALTRRPPRRSPDRVLHSARLPADRGGRPRLFQKTAIGFTGEPVPPTMSSGAATNRNSHRRLLSQVARRSSNWR